MATLPDNAIDLIADDEVERYGVVRVADEIIAGLMKTACGVSFEQAAPHIDARNVSFSPPEGPIADGSIDTIRGATMARR